MHTSRFLRLITLVLLWLCYITNNLLLFCLVVCYTDLQLWLYLVSVLLKVLISQSYYSEWYIHYKLTDMNICKLCALSVLQNWLLFTRSFWMKVWEGLGYEDWGRQGTLKENICLSHILCYNKTVDVSSQQYRISQRLGLWRNKSSFFCRWVPT